MHAGQGAPGIDLVGAGLEPKEPLWHCVLTFGNLERRIHDAERNLFASVGADVEESSSRLGRLAAVYECYRMGAGRRWCCSTARRSTPPFGRHCLRSFLNSSCSRWTFQATACLILSGSSAVRSATRHFR